MSKPARVVRTSVCERTHGTTHSGGQGHNSRAQEQSASLGVQEPHLVCLYRREHAHITVSVFGDIEVGVGIHGNMRWGIE